MSLFSARIVLFKKQNTKRRSKEFLVVVVIVTDSSFFLLFFVIKNSMYNDERINFKFCLSCYIHHARFVCVCARSLCLDLLQNKIKKYTHTHTHTLLFIIECLLITYRRYVCVLVYWNDLLQWTTEFEWWWWWWGEGLRFSFIFQYHLYEHAWELFDICLSKEYEKTNYFDNIEQWIKSMFNDGPVLYDSLIEITFRWDYRLKKSLASWEDGIELYSSVD